MTGKGRADRPGLDYLVRLQRKGRFFTPCITRIGAESCVDELTLGVARQIDTVAAEEWTGADVTIA
ncbi:hypothetical protein CVN68_14300 [Sphingomonas psychrotolerans]|uniref:Uncharacterized protein n=1 Tax=Sphingomonas psychrotolerans TaxID=1327635 RepID=A0A2K8MME0_9SPHN|nr:hypothetical protein CVN68_14300 [Sphingomonas psychrotolerans]